MKKYLFTLGCIAALMALVSSCGGGGGSDSGGDNLGPTSASSFVGSTVSFNPTIKFLSGGIIEYSNEVSSPFFGSDFPTTAAGNPEAGTYFYVPSQDYTTGTLTIILPNIVNSPYSVDIPVTDFVTVNGLVQSFKVNIPNGGTYVATVESGQIIAAMPPSENGSGSSPYMLNSDGSLVAGTMITKSYKGATSTEAQQDGSFPTILFRRTIGETETFIISSNGDFLLETIDGVLSIPFSTVAPGFVSYKYLIPATKDIITIVIDIKSSTGLMSIRWEEDLANGGTYDFERQIWE